MHRSLFSLGQPAIADRLRHLIPDVPDVIMRQAGTEVEKHLLKQVSCLDQQNVIIGEVLDAVLVQTTTTNGRVTDGEKRDEEVSNRLAAHNKVISMIEAKNTKWRRWQTLALTAIFPFVTAVILFVMDIIAKKLHWT